MRRVDTPALLRYSGAESRSRRICIMSMVIEGGSALASRSVCITGGASFIGSHLAERLVREGAVVTVADDFSSGTRENLRSIQDRVRIVEGDLRELAFAREALAGSEIVFHLAASHGGRGYIDTHPADCSSNMLLDGSVMRAAHLDGVERFCFASSACVYPVDLQAPGHREQLAEDAVNLRKSGGASADGEYGWAKLMGEMALAAYGRQYGSRGVSCRIFTAYGERENATHAIIALILRALMRQDPYVIWGDGTQARNFTHVADLVDGLIAASLSVTDCSAINLGAETAYTTLEVAQAIWRLTGWEPSEVRFEGQKPAGVHYRNADSSRARRLMGWSAKIALDEGLRRTIDWVESTTDLDAMRDGFEQRLMER
jgi:nucleoside-diphosphate-sugar epimerase